MQIELKNSYDNGFILNEQDFRRIVDTVKEKLTDKTGNQCIINYTYKLKNGALLETNNIDLLLKEENMGSKRIVFLIIEFDMMSKDNKVKIIFCDIFEQDSQYSSFRYTISGSDRDSLFVLASELDERLKSISIKRFSTNRRPLVLLIPMTLMIIIFYISIIFQVPNSELVKKEILDLISNSSYGNDIAGMKSLIIDIEKIKSSPKTLYVNLNQYVTIFLTLLPFPLSFALNWFFRTYFYPYNFYGVIMLIVIRVN